MRGWGLGIDVILFSLCFQLFMQLQGHISEGSSWAVHYKLMFLFCHFKELEGKKEFFTLLAFS